MIFLWTFVGILPALVLRFIFGKRFDVKSSLAIAFACSLLIFLLQIALEGSRTFIFGVTFPIVYAISKGEKPENMDTWEYHKQRRGLF